MSTDAVKRWLLGAPPAALLSIMLAALGALAGWVWAVDAQVKDQKAVTAVAATQASAIAEGHRDLAEHVNRVEANANARITEHERGVENRLSRIETKVDKLLEQVAYMRSHPEEKKP